jgi:predicted deacylase
VLSCDIGTLNLTQGAEYTATLERYFGDTKLTELGGGTFTTLRALTLENASVTDGQVVYEKTPRLAFTFDKDVSLAKATLKQKKGDSWEVLPTTVSIEERTIVVSSTTELARIHDYELTLDAVEAADGSALPELRVVRFSLSGGPKITGVSIDPFGAPLAGTITLTFDQEIANDDKITELMTVTGLNARVTKSGQRLLISYTGAPRCHDFTLGVQKGFESQYGVMQTDDWTFASRTQCYSVFSIGSSKQGRAITAYSFGSGARKVLYTGAIHGNEQGTRLLMFAWVDELDANPKSIPGGVTIVIIPAVNPDGIAANSRYNSTRVDLNRNFNVSDWKKDIETPYGEPHPGGGGPSPGSEPETQALAAYTAQLRPALTLSYHSVASYVVANTCGNSASLAREYSRLSGYRNMTGVASAFDYEITGTYDDWICEQLGLPSVLIELATSGNAEFSRNKAALWAMARS